MSSRLVVTGFALLTAVALVGWTRKAEIPATQPQFSQSQSAPQTAPANAPYPAYPEAAATNSTGPAAAVEAARERRPVEHPAVHYYRRVRHERPMSHSVAIVGASAGTGAAIGALAGGGRGAGIGALAGGAAGFIYDRLTHNR
ncbi:MAG TPA: hypothetical protein VJN43_17820 [Bryobacteraceae bacterium]|nr:hypothetical protein [Bryobacteraceae bacterium]